jgi:PAS domain S-box-containing protein
MDGFFNAAKLSVSGRLMDVIRIFDGMPDVYIYAKNTESEFIFANEAFIQLLGTDEHEIIGRTDRAFFEKNMAELYIDEDQHVFAGRKIVNRRWMVPDSSGSISWYLSTKLPLHDEKDNIIGLCGVLRDLKIAGKEAKPYFDLSEVIEYINLNFSNRISSSVLADILGLSVSQLDRKFKAFAGVSPQTYILKVRVNAAAQELVKTDKSITRIYLDNGFSDQSYFGRQFKKVTGMTPRQYRLSFL